MSEKVKIFMINPLDNMDFEKRNFVSNSKYLKNDKAWKIINLFIIIFMSSLAFYVLLDIFNLKNRIF